MKFGIREVCDVNFIKKSGIGPESFRIESAKMTTLETASTTVYAQGGKGNSRLIAWEGEKTVTFTIEDALITKDTFWALTGATRSPQNGNKFTITSTSFAGYYSISADTLFRDEDGKDYKATITIPRAKLQTALSLSMAPTGDPSTFTFTLDAFPSGNIKEIFSLEIEDNTADMEDVDGATYVSYGGETLSTTSETPALTVTGTTVKLNDKAFTQATTAEGIHNFETTLQSGTLNLVKGSRTNWYNF